jgi:N utilization substance protein B
MQTLFERDIAREMGRTVDADEALKRNGEEYAPGVGDFSFMENLLRGVLARQGDLDAIIEKAAPDWPIAKISPVDRNILRLGLYELLFADRSEVPAKVAINEAIELAKTYGGESSGKFVNGVLGAVYKEIGEPGKNETSKKKRNDVPYDELPIERLVGAVVYAKNGREIYLALVHDIFGHWTLSKGKLNPNEDERDGVVRKIKEEIGLTVKPLDKLGENEYVASDPEVGKKRKHVSYYLAESKFEDITLEEKGGLDDAKWFKVADIVDLNFYNDILPLVTKALNLLAGDSKEGVRREALGVSKGQGKKK